MAEKHIKKKTGKYKKTLHKSAEEQQSFLQGSVVGASAEA